MTSSENNSSDYEILNRCNHTELYALCRRQGFQIPPTTPREKMILFILGEEEPPLGYNDIDSWRHGIIGFLLDHWDVVQSQLQCPAKKLRDEKEPDPRPCFKCTDQMVISCIVDNKNNERLIQLHRKREP